MHKITILLVEDHVVVRESIRQLLDRESDLEVVGEAGNGEEAVRLTTQLKPDIVLMDVAMPNVNGIEATKGIKELCPATAVLALSAYDYDQYIFALLEAGAAGYLLKDVSGQELVDAIRAVRRGDCVLHPTVARKVVARFRRAPSEERESGVLAEREKEVLKRAAKGMCNKDIADELFVSVRTVEAQLQSIFNKLGVGSRTEAVVCSLKRGLFTLEDIELE
ncbi:MAG: response regulator transcription factor [Dehalococcoidia bacterium]|nr:MAG: response regulator transcription factor [Dehalococcoidia bacterium]